MTRAYRPRRTTPRYADLDVAALLQHTADMTTLAELGGVTTRTLHRWAHTGLTLADADRLAIAVGAHPAELWSCWFDLERRAKNAAKMRRYRQRPEAAAAHRRASKAHYEATAEYVKARRRAYYRANREQLRAERRARYYKAKAA